MSTRSGRAFLAMRDIAHVELRGVAAASGGLSQIEIKKLQLRRQEAYIFLGGLHAEREISTKSRLRSRSRASHRSCPRS